MTRRHGEDRSSALRRNAGRSAEGATQSPRFEPPATTPPDRRGWGNVVTTFASDRPGPIEEPDSASEVLTLG